MTTPPPDAASAVLTLWRVTDGYLTTTWVEGTPHAPYPGEAQVCERFVALRPHQHLALLTRVEAAEGALAAARTASEAWRVFNNSKKRKDDVRVKERAHAFYHAMRGLRLALRASGTREGGA